MFSLPFLLLKFEGGDILFDMKKIVLIIFCFMLSNAAFAIYERTDTTPYSPQFNLRMHYCIPINDTQPLDDGTKVIRRIVGFQDHLCRFAVEKYDANGKMTEKTSCRLTQPQRIQFINAVKGDMAGVAAAKDFVDNIFKDEQVCKIEKF